MAASTGSLPPLRRSAPERDAAANPSHGVRQGRRRNYRAAAAHPCAHPGPGCAHTTYALLPCTTRPSIPVSLLSLTHARFRVFSPLCCAYHVFVEMPLLCMA
jgi:hypothetical protein